MDENSCEDETTKSVENVVDAQAPKETDNTFELADVKVKTGTENRINKYQVSDRCGSSCDASAAGTSTDFSFILTEILERIPDKEITAPDSVENLEHPDANVENTQERNSDNNQITPLLPVYDEAQASRNNVETLVLAPQPRRLSIGPPPSYSFVMKQKKKVKLPTTTDPVITSRPPPPAYGGPRGLYVTSQEGQMETICNLPSFGEPIWRSHSQPAFCPRCGVVVLTTAHSHDSIATHLAALALCLFGCWPCCLLPYCMNVCKNTYHHCPVCQGFLGIYSPW